MKKHRMTLIKTPTALYEEADDRYHRLLSIQQELASALANYPPGKIHVVSTAKRTQFYLREDSADKSGKYIPKSDVSTIATYLQKAYDEKALRLIDTEIANLKRLLNHSESPISQIRNLYSACPREAKQFISPIDISDEDYSAAWLSQPYTGKEINDLIPFYETNQKERVRSKSELNIANALAAHKIPYKYECPLQLNDGNAIYPDFTILHLKQRREIYWEHRGMMDDRLYATNSVMRIKTLNKNGIFLGTNLIITEETSTGPLGTNEIELMIKTYLTN